MERWSFLFCLNIAIIFGVTTPSAAYAATLPTCRTQVAQLSFDHARELIPVVIIGAGPAGLSVASSLKSRGIPSIVLEASSQVGHSFEEMPTHLRLLSPGSANTLPGPREKQQLAPHHLTSRRDYAAYLKDYSKRQDLLVLTDSPVTQLQRESDDTLTVQTPAATLRARVVVNATGYFGHPFIPNFEGRQNTAVRQIHVAQYKEPSQIENLVGSKEARILIVGKRLSAGQTMVELYKSGFQNIDLSFRGEIEFGLSPEAVEKVAPFVGIYEFFKLAENHVFGRPETQNNTDQIPMEGGLAKELITSQTVRSLPNVKRFTKDSVEFEDGRSQKYELVIYCTGFRPVLNHLGPLVSIDSQSGMPPLTGMQSQEVPGLYFIGLDGLTNFRSRFIRGMREDAKTLSDEISNHLKRL